MTDDHTEDEAAFPRVVTPGFDEVVTGMTLRDYFAAAALKGVLRGYHACPDNAADAAHAAFELADAMLEEREKQ